MNAVEPPFCFVHYAASATILLQKLHTAGVRNRQRPVSITMDTNVAAAVARPFVVVAWRKVNVVLVPVGEVRCTTTFELRRCYITHSNRN